MNGVVPTGWEAPRILCYVCLTSPLHTLITVNPTIQRCPPVWRAPLILSSWVPLMCAQALLLLREFGILPVCGELVIIIIAIQFKAEEGVF